MEVIDKSSNEEVFGGRPAYLFNGGDQVAVTLDATAVNLPDPDQWKLVESFTLGVRNGGLPQISPEPIIRGIASQGYYIWNTSEARGGEGTTR